jgi:hypothetical protein
MMKARRDNLPPPCDVKFEFEFLIHKNVRQESVLIIGCRFFNTPKVGHLGGPQDVREQKNRWMDSQRHGWTR